MGKLATNEVLQFLVILTILLGVARFMGELFKKFGLPAIIGELLGGIILGPSLIGSYFPVFSRPYLQTRSSPVLHSMVFQG
jgi:Kef-type K+ transport system membrane component KefB